MGDGSQHSSSAEQLEVVMDPQHPLETDDGELDIEGLAAEADKLSELHDDLRRQLDADE